MHRALVSLILLLAGTVAFGSSPDTCTLTSTVPDADVNLAISDGRSSFREGEIIPLVLSFTSTADKRYWANNRSYDRSGRLNIETYCLEPSARDPVLDYFSSRTLMGGGLYSTQQLSEKPFTATAELNEWQQPAPGHYRLHVISHRVWRPADPNESSNNASVEVTLRSNTIEFDVIKGDAAWAAEQLREATAFYQGDDAERQREAARRLRFLQTKESALTLARLFWGLNEQPGGWDLMFGLFGSPFRAEAIAAMQSEISEPSHPITQQFLQTLARLQISADPGWDLPAYDPAHPKESHDYWQKLQARERELVQAAATATAAALPKKTGRARAITVEALAQSSDLLSATTAAQMRQQLVAAWDDLPDRTKWGLIQFRWELVEGPEILPALKKFVAGPAPPFRTEPAMARDAALKHIFELDPEEARSLILRDLRDPKAQPSLSLVKLVPPAALRPIVRDAIARIEKSDARELDYHLLELFGDKSAVRGAETVFIAHLGQWACDPQSAMLRYFLKFDPEFGTKVVRASLAARKETGCYHSLLQDLGNSLPKVEELAIGALDDEDLEVANDAALALGRWGTAKAESGLWARLTRFHDEWEDREAELRVTPDYRSPIARATMLEGTLVHSIATGTSWFCDAEKFERLAALALPQHRAQIAAWSNAWQRGNATILQVWHPEEQLSFGMQQYAGLDEGQFRSKLSQLPQGTILHFQIWKPGQIAPPVSMEKQMAMFESLRSYAAQFGVTIVAKSDP